MQLYALDEQGAPLLANNAGKGVDYRCPECGGAVRLREGPFRRAHFYHRAPPPHCRQGGKGLAHLQVQLAFLERLPAREVRLECPFPAIGRIADVVWEPQRLIFEVQCSPISAEEVAARNRDYRQAGYQVVWILHDQRYNKRRVTAAERWLQEHPHYFTSINEEGEGLFYDQWSGMRGGCRQTRSPLYPIDVAMPTTTARNPIPPRAGWGVHFAGDLSDQPGQEDVLAWYAEKKKPVSWVRKIQRLYSILFRHLLEQACK